MAHVRGEAPQTATATADRRPQTADRDRNIAPRGCRDAYRMAGRTRGGRL